MKNRMYQAELLFEQALELAHAERKVWLAEQCGSDEALYSEVCRLLELQLEASDLFLADDDATFANSPAADDLPDGTRLGEFVIESKLGEGGMGIVYRARQHSLNRIVALKVLRSHAHLTPSHRKRFKVEMEAAARLQHPNIIGVHTTGSSADRLYYAMEYVDGLPLSEVVDRLRNSTATEWADCATTIPLPAKESIATVSNSIQQLQNPSPSSVPQINANQDGTHQRIENPDNYFDWVAHQISNVAKAIHFAHGNQVLHRALKPSNLLLTSCGTIRVGDFGLARDLSEPGITQTGEVIGTPYYMAPEQIRAGALVTRGVDIYALGATLYELLTLRLPFPGTSRDQVMTQIVHEEVVPPRQLNSSIALDLETICLKCLEKEPKDRYLSADDLSSDLERFLRREPIRAKRAGLMDRTVKWIDRHRALAASIIALPVCVAIVSTVFAVRNHRLASALELESKRANESFIEAKIEQARAVIGTTRPTRRSQALQSIQAALQVLPKLELEHDEAIQKRNLLRNEAIAALTVTELSVQQQWPVNSPWTSEVEFTSDYKTYAQPSRDGRIRIRHLSDQSAERVLSCTEEWPARQMKFSPDGRFLASKHYVRGPQGNAKLYVWDLASETSEPTLELLQRYIFLFDFDFAPTRPELATVNPHGEVEIYSLESGELARTIPVEFPTSAVLAYSDQGLLAMAAYRQRTLHIWNAGPMVQEVDRVELSRNISALAWRSNQDEVAIATTNGEVHIWPLGSLHNAPKILMPHKNEIVSLHFQPNGTLLASRTLDQKAAISDIASLRSHPLLTEDLDRIHIMESGFSEGGQRLGYRRPTEFGIYEASRSVRSILSSDENPKPVHEVRFHPKYSRLLARTTASGLEFWDTRDRQLISKISGESHLRMQFAPDGQNVYAGGLQNGISRWPIEVALSNEHLQIKVGDRQQLYDGSCRSLQLSPRGDYLAVLSTSQGTEQRKVTVLNAMTGETVLQDHVKSKVRFMNFDENENHFCAAKAEGATVQVWDLGTGKRIREDHFPVPSGFIAYSNERRTFVQSLPSKVNIIPAGKTAPLHSISLSPRKGMRTRFSRDGKLAVTSSSTRQKLLIDTVSGKVLASLNASTQEESVSYDFSPDGKLLSVGGRRDIYVWDLAQLKSELEEMRLEWVESTE
ncbi:MAG: protein kinase [Pirellulaceae bacterium]